MIVTQDMTNVRQAALELMVESMKEEDVARQIGSLLDQDADPDTLAKIAPPRKLADAYYEYANFIGWLKARLDAGLEIEILADDAEGLLAYEEAWHEFQSKYPACPQCGTRQYSRMAISCRNSRCGAKFGKAV